MGIWHILFEKTKQFGKFWHSSEDLITKILNNMKLSLVYIHDYVSHKDCPKEEDLLFLLWGFLKKINHKKC